MGRLPAIGSKTERVLVGLARNLAWARSLSIETRSVRAATFRPADIQPRVMSALLHNMARRGIVCRAGRGSWGLTEVGYALVGKLSAKRRKERGSRRR